MSSSGLNHQIKAALQTYIGECLDVYEKSGRKSNMLQAFLDAAEIDITHDAVRLRLTAGSFLVF